MNLVNIEFRALRGPTREEIENFPNEIRVDDLDENNGNPDELFANLQDSLKKHPMKNIIEKTYIPCDKKASAYSRAKAPLLTGKYLTLAGFVYDNKSCKEMVFNIIKKIAPDFAESTVEVIIKKIANVSTKSILRGSSESVAEVADYLFKGYDLSGIACGALIGFIIEVVILAIRCLFIKDLSLMDFVK